MELLTKLYSEFTEFKKDITGKVDGLAGKVDGLAGKVDYVEAEAGNIKGIVIRIEDNHGKKLGALFDGYVQNSEKLDRIEAEVAKHDEFIMKRIK